MGFQEFSDALRELRGGQVPGLVCLERTESTSSLARRIVDDYRAEGCTPPAADLVAWDQMAGRGREGRSWSCRPGYGLYITAIRTLPTELLRQLPVAVGLALCTVLRQYLGDSCRLKWPNDLYLGQRKLGGILIDSVMSSGSDAPSGSAQLSVSNAGDDVGAVADESNQNQAVATIGFGINYDARVADLGQAGATSFLAHLQEHPEPASGETAADGDPPPPTMAQLAGELLASLDRHLREDAARERWAQTYEHYSMHGIGEVLEFRDAQGSSSGLLLGFDDDGRMRLEVAGEERILSAGEVRLRVD